MKTILFFNCSFFQVPRENAGDSRERIKRFSFDFCFDSSSNQNQEYATQTMVYFCLLYSFNIFKSVVHFLNTNAIYSGI